MNHEYFLIGRKMKDTEKCKEDVYFIIDKFVANGIKEVEKEFLRRNLKSKDEEFIIVESKRWIS